MPRLDDRDAALVVADLLQRLPGYVPGWTPQPGSVGGALAQIFGRYMEVLIERLNAAPDKNFLAFLDLLGQSLVEARPARAPVVFKFSPPTAPALPAASTSSAINLPAPPTPLALPVLNIRVPQATQVTATPPGGAPLVFETENAIALISAKLAQVVSLWPGQDTYSDHSAALAAGTPITLFRSKEQTPHVLYLAHDGYFALKGSARVEIEFDLLAASSVSLPILWEYWDGQGWHAFGDPDTKTDSPTADLNDATQGLTRSGVISLCADCVNTEPTTVSGQKAYWLRGRLTEPLPPDLSRQDALVTRIRANTVIERLIDPEGIDELPAQADLTETSGVKPDAAFSDGTNLDLSKAFYPFGQAPAPGSVFCLSSDEAFGKPNATVRLALFTTSGPLGDASDATTIATVAWEFWDGARWVGLTLTNDAPTFTGDTLSGFVVPENGIPQSKLNSKDGRWVRARITAGGFYRTRTIHVDGVSPDITVNENLPPLLADVRIGYVYRSPRSFPEICLSHNDFAYADHTADVRWSGTGFAAYRSLADATPALYLGFDKPLPVDLVSLYFDIQEQEDQGSNPPLVWEYWDGASWREVAVQDDTTRLIRPGMIAFVGAADAESLARFDAPLSWLRGRLREDGEPVQNVINGIYPNAVWAMQATTTRDETLGSGSGEPTQTFFFRNKPVLSDEVIEVRELDGVRAAVELPILAREVDAANLNVVYGAKNVVSEVWVRWQRQPNLYLSGANDRHYVLERSGGKVIFGDGVNGRLLPAGRDNVAARTYRWGGGAAGNVAPGAITQLLGGIPYVSGVNNPKPAQGGADSETVEQIHARGPQSLMNRGRALAAADYESLARESSPGVAVARALPATNPSGRPAPGWVKLIIVPGSARPQPQPSFELRREVQEYLLARAPLGLAGLYVTGPTYLPVGVAAVVIPLDLMQAGPVGVVVRQTLEAFFHPLTGGPDGAGWPFGRDVFISDVAAALEAVDGVDYVQELDLLLDGLPQGDVVEVPPDRIVVAGAMQIRIRASEG